MLFNIGKGAVSRGPIHRRESLEVLFVEIDEKTFANFVAVHAIREAIRKKLGRRVLAVDLKNMRFEGEEELKNALPARIPEYLAKLKWATVEIDSESLKRAQEPE